MALGQKLRRLSLGPSFAIEYLCAFSEAYSHPEPQFLFLNIGIIIISIENSEQL
jgi:hypothetical protein